MIRSCNHCGHLVADKTPAVCPSCGAPGTWTDCAEQRRRPRGRKIRFERITIRVTREEKAKLADAARLAGVALGAWLAELGMAAAAGEFRRLILRGGYIDITNGPLDATTVERLRRFLDTGGAAQRAD